MRRQFEVITLLLVMHSATGCAGVHQPARGSRECGVQTLTTRHELFFGLELPGGNEIHETDFDTFMNSVVTPLFPDGLTVLDAEGQYRTAAGVLVDEPTKVVVLIYPDNAEVRERIAEIIAQYRSQFRQESVGWVRTPACASF